MIRRICSGALIAANLAVLGIALSQKWGYYSVLLVFWMESPMIGFFNLLRMGVTGLFGSPFGKHLSWTSNPLGRVAALAFLGGFFVVKFAGVAFALFMGLLMMPVVLEPGHAHPADLVVVTDAFQEASAGVGPAALGLFISHAISFFWNFLGRREYKTANLVLLLVWPYARMLLPLAVLTAGILLAHLLPGFSLTTVFAIGVIALKLVGDLVSHQIEHRQSDP